MAKGKIKQMEKFGFVYLWRDRKHKRFYVGRHWGTEDDGYICSSRWMRQTYNRRPKDFKRRILSYVLTNKKDLVQEEQKWLNLIKKPELGNRYYNKTLKSDAPSMFGRVHSEETKMKISKAHQGKKMSLESRQKMSKSFTGRIHSDDTKQKMRGRIPWNKGQKLSLEFRNKLSESHKGIKQSQETIEKRKLSRDGYRHTEETKRKISETHRVNNKRINLQGIKCNTE